MILIKKGYPEENEIVMCTVTKVQFHSVFVNLDEYERKSGLVHISEISPGRIRNIRDYVTEGKVIVCKVLRVNTERDLIDLSLRRVNEKQRRDKINTVKQEQIAEKIIEFVADKEKINSKKLYMDIYKKIEKDYDFIYYYFEDVVDDNSIIKELNLPKAIEDKLLEIIKQRIKPPEVVVEGRLSFISYSSDGVKDIKELAKNIKSLDSKNIVMKNLGGGKYNITITDSNYKDAEKKYEEIKNSISDFISNIDCISDFKRIEHAK
jgi:translation initiation factor 2 subunit 1